MQSLNLFVVLWYGMWSFSSSAILILCDWLCVSGFVIVCALVLFKSVSVHKSYQKQSLIENCVCRAHHLTVVRYTPLNTFFGRWCCGLMRPQHCCIVVVLPRLHVNSVEVKSVCDSPLKIVLTWNRCWLLIILGIPHPIIIREYELKALSWFCCNLSADLPKNRPQHLFVSSLVGSKCLWSESKREGSKHFIVMVCHDYTLLLLLFYLVKSSRRSTGKVIFLWPEWISSVTPAVVV